MFSAFSIYDRNILSSNRATEETVSILKLQLGLLQELLDSEKENNKRKMLLLCYSIYRIEFMYM